MDMVIVWDWDSGQHSPAIVIARTSEPRTPNALARWGVLGAGAEDGAGVNRGGDQGEVNSLSMPPRKQQNKL